ncbi:MAG TPA: EAL domain-containing protein, partial [Iamia sp.]|nr:EAL domain-containing protein [Iamia sp.]
EEQLAHQAFHDPLTGVANRALIVDRIDHALRRGNRTGADPAVIFLDVDGFKSVNDRLGHEAGDAVLRQIADRLVATVRVEDTVARLGGDEFAVLVEANHSQADEARTTAERILQTMGIPMEVGDELIAVSASIGVAVANPRSTTASLIRDADIAMYQAKAGGKAQVIVYDVDMGTQAGEALQLETDLAHAVERGELELFYQPVVDLSDESVVGFEALLRWWHPRLGLVLPDRFIPIAESTGLIVPIGRWVLDTACATAARWQEADPDGTMTMAINVSARQLASDDIIDHVSHALTASGLDPGRLVLEMTESALVVDPEETARRLRALRALGPKLAIDDFGTGFSSLSYLRQFPVDILKIDRSFIETITDDTPLPPIVRGLLDLGRTLDLEIVAEGIERDVQRTWLRDQSCELGQGFLFSRPLPAAEAERLLQKRTPADPPPP